jgi:hypothetical protein
MSRREQMCNLIELEKKYKLDIDKMLCDVKIAKIDITNKLI